MTIPTSNLLLHEASWIHCSWKHCFQFKKKMAVNHLCKNVKRWICWLYTYTRQGFNNEKNLNTRVWSMFLPNSETSSMSPLLSVCTAHESYDNASTRMFPPKSCGSQFWAQQSWGLARLAQVLFQVSTSSGLFRPWNKTTSNSATDTSSLGGQSWCTSWSWEPKYHNTTTMRCSCFFKC